MILHICSRQAWNDALKNGAYRGNTLETEGFIHCSTQEQIIEVADQMFRRIIDFILLIIDETKVAAEIKYEDAGNKKLHPHIYGPLNSSAVGKTVDFPLSSSGRFKLPYLE